MSWANLSQFLEPCLSPSQIRSWVCTARWTQYHTITKPNVALRTMHKRRCFIRRCTHHDSQMTLLLADVSARLKLKDSRASFVGTRAEDKKIKLNQHYRWCLPGLWRPFEKSGCLKPKSSVSASWHSQLCLSWGTSWPGVTSGGR